MADNQGRFLLLNNPRQSPNTPHRLLRVFGIMPVWSEQRGHTKLSLRLSGIITNLDKDIISARNQLGSKGGPAERRFRQDSDSTNPAGSLEEDTEAKPVTLKKPSRRHNTDEGRSHGFAPSASPAFPPNAGQDSTAAPEQTMTN